MSTNVPDSPQRLLYREGRAVIEAQNRTMAEVDDKAMRIVRLNVVIIGLVIAAIQIESTQFNVWFSLAGVLVVVCSSLSGIVTVDESNLYVGSRGNFLRRLNSDTPESVGREHELIGALAGMIVSNEAAIERNVAWLRITNLLSIVGIVLLFAATLF